MTEQQKTRPTCGQLLPAAAEPASETHSGDRQIEEKESGEISEFMHNFLDGFLKRQQSGARPGTGERQREIEKMSESELDAEFANSARAAVAQTSIFKRKQK